MVRRMPWSWRAVLAAALLLAAAPNGRAATVRVEGGEVTGLAAKDGPAGVVRYLGIPYAAVPLAGLR